MTAQTVTPPPPPTPALGSPGPHVAGLLRSEWTKLRTVRSTIWSFAALVVLSVGFTILFTAVISHQWAHQDPSDQAQIRFDPTSVILGVAFQFGQLAICVLGVLVIASEYSTGMIRASLLAVPKRIPMLVAKAVVFAVVVFVVSEVVAMACFFIGSSILHSHAPVSLGDAGVLRAVIGAGMYLAVLGLFALAIGAIVRNTAGAITGVIAFVLVLVPISQLLPGSLGDDVHAYLPTSAGQLIGQAHRADGDLLGPWQGFGIFCLWTAVLLVIAGYLLRRRDA